MRRIIDEHRDIAYLEGDTHLSQWVHESGQVRAERDPVCAHNVSHIKHGHWVVDAGAALGDHALSYQDKVGAAGRVLAFEPNPDYFGCLKYNCPESSCFELALWDQAGIQKMTRKISGNAGAFHIGNEDGDTMVKTIALDDLKLPRLDFYKLDIEGAELFAIRGSMETIKQFKPLIQCEIFEGAMHRLGHSPDQLYGLIESMGYKIEFIHFINDTGDHNRELLATPIK